MQIVISPTMEGASVEWGGINPLDAIRMIALASYKAVDMPGSRKHGLQSAVTIAKDGGDVIVTADGCGYRVALKLLAQAQLQATTNLLNVISDSLHQAEEKYRPGLRERIVYEA